MVARSVPAAFAALVLTLASILGAAGAEGATSPAGGPWIVTPNGLVGVKQLVTVRAPRAAGQVVAITFSSDATGTNTGEAPVDSRGFAYLPWTPDMLGAWTLTTRVRGADADLASSAITVEAMPTSTTLLAPGVVPADRQSTLTAQVRALGGHITPSGTVIVRDQSDQIVAQQPVRPSSQSGTANASLTWTPDSGSTSLTAEFTPDSAAFASSTSMAQTPNVGVQPALTLQLPQVSYVGVEDSYEVQIRPDLLDPQGGSAAFSVAMDGFTFYPMGGSRPIGDGVSTDTWAPDVPGVQTIQVSYSSADSRFSATAAQPINVQPAPLPDTITSDDPGFDTGVPVPVGTRIEPLLTASSGNPVTVSSDGPCIVDAGTVTMLGVGTCTLQASSLGNGGSLKPATEAFAFEVVRAGN